MRGPIDRQSKVRFNTFLRALANSDRVSSVIGSARVVGRSIASAVMFIVCALPSAWLLPAVGANLPTVAPVASCASLQFLDFSQLPGAITRKLPMLDSAAPAGPEMRTDRRDALRTRRLDREQMPPVRVTGHRLDVGGFSRERVGHIDGMIAGFRNAVAAMAHPRDREPLNHATPRAEIHDCPRVRAGGTAGHLQQSSRATRRNRRSPRRPAPEPRHRGQCLCAQRAARPRTAA